MSSLSMNANITKATEDTDCLKGAYIASSALADLYDLSYEMEYNLFDNLYTACVLNGGWN